MLYQPTVVREILERHGFAFKKQLGQNFLIDGNIVQKILDEGEISAEDAVIEIGPGIGTLTEALAGQAREVFAIEKDESLKPILEETLPYDNVKVLYEDVLACDLRGIVEALASHGPVKVVANLPYYITTPIIAKILEERLPVDAVIVMVQEEVGKRMVAQPGGKDYGALSLLCQYFAEPKIVIKVPASVFMPKPKVDSVVVRLDIILDKDYPYEREMFILIRKAFTKRRKTLANALEGLASKEVLQKALDKAGIQQNLRPENLGLSAWMALTNVLEGEHANE